MFCGSSPLPDQNGGQIKCLFSLNIYNNIPIEIYINISEKPRQEQPYSTNARYKLFVLIMYWIIFIEGKYRLHLYINSSFKVVSVINYGHFFAILIVEITSLSKPIPCIVRVRA